MFGSQNNDVLLTLYRDNRTVFRLIDVSMLTGETDLLVLGKKLNYYVRKGQLHNPRKGIYSKPEYNTEELACRIYSPSYLSLEYVLQKSGVIFQYDSQMTLISYLSRSVVIKDQYFRFRKLKGPILINTNGIIRQNNQVNLACPERAFLDILYLEPNYYFDNLHPLDKSVIKRILPVYQSNALNRRIKTLFDNA